MPRLLSGDGDSPVRGDAGDASSLEGGDDEPPDLVDVVLAPRSIPVSDRSDRLARGRVDDLEHATGAGIREAFETRLALDQLLVALGPADVLRHLGISQRHLQDWKISRSP